VVTVNDGSNDDDDDNNDNNDDGDEAIWESLDSDAAVVLLCVGCEDEVHLPCLGLAAVPDGDWFSRACQPSASAKAAARLLPATEQVHEADIERKQEVKNDRGGDEEIDDTDKDQVNLCIALVYVPRGVL